MNFLQLVDQMIKAVRCFEGFEAVGVGCPTFFGRVFLISIHYNPWIPRYLVGSLPINIESKHEALGPSLARGKSQVSQLCAGASARGTSLNSDRQGSLNAPHPKPWVLNIAGSFQTILIPSIYSSQINSC